MEMERPPEGDVVERPVAGMPPGEAPPPAAGADAAAAVDTDATPGPEPDAGPEAGPEGPVEVEVVVVGVRFQRAGKVHYLAPGGLELAVNDRWWPTPSAA